MHGTCYREALFLNVVIFSISESDYNFLIDGKAMGKLLFLRKRVLHYIRLFHQSLGIDY